jgi:hypothetical protein
MVDYKTIFGVAAVIIGLIGYIPYFRDIFKKKTKPHVFSWFVWGLLAGISFFAQITKGAGPGAWVMGLSAIICLVVSILAVFWGEKKITWSDWLAFIGALLGLVLWRLTNDPLLAVILVTITDALAFIPTIRKSYNNPYGEIMTAWVCYSLKFVIGLVAIQAYNVTTLLYPLALVVMNGSFTVMLYLRRKKLKNKLITS